MFKKATYIAAAIVLAALLVSVATPASAAAKRRVIVVLAPYLNWSDISSSMPSARALAEKAILVDMNVRAGGVMGASTPERGALVLSAGSPVEYAEGALSAYGASETLGATPARDLYRQYFGAASGGAQILFLGQPRQLLVNSSSTSPALIGALGSAAHAAGVRTAAIGNGDLGMWADPLRSSRPAGVAAADASGTVDLGDVSNEMLSADPASPFGVRANVKSILAQFTRVIADPDVKLVVIDPGDLARSNAMTSFVTSPAAAAMRARALRATDDVLGGIMAKAGPDDAIVLVAQAVVSVPDMPAGYGPAVISDGAGAGIGVSSATHRDGIVTETDVTATIVELLGGTLPASMIGSRVRASGAMSGASLADRIGFLDRLNTSSVAVESVRLPVVNTFIVLAVIVLVGATLVLYRGHDGLPAWAYLVARVALLVPVAVLLGAALQSALWRWPPSGNDVVLALAVCTVIVLALAVLSMRGRLAGLPLIVLSGLTTVTLLVDQWIGAPLSLTGLFSYSAVLGARYYGMGNEMAGLLLGSAIVAFTLALDTWPNARYARALRLWGWPALGVVLLATTTVTFWGANVGAAAWMTVGFVVGWMMLNGKRVLTWRNLVIVIVLVVIVVAGLSVVESMGGADSQTHLGRALAGAETGGISTLWTIVVRKAETNVRVLGRTNWTWMLLAVLLLLGYMRWRPRGEFAEMLKRYPAFSAGIAATIFAGVTGFFTEDSGIIVPALMFIPVGFAALYLMLHAGVPREGDRS